MCDGGEKAPENATEGLKPLFAKLLDANEKVLVTLHAQYAAKSTEPLVMVLGTRATLAKLYPNYAGTNPVGVVASSTSRLVEKLTATGETDVIPHLLDTRPEGSVRVFLMDGRHFAVIDLVPSRSLCNLDLN